MTITRLCAHLLLYATSAASAWAGVAAAQQQVSATTQVAAPQCKAAFPGKSNPCGLTSAMSQRNSPSRINQVAGTAPAHTGSVYQPRQRSAVDQYQNAVTPPVVSGR